MSTSFHVSICAALLLTSTLVATSCSDAPSAPATGAQLFMSQCSMCHNQNGEGSKLGPTLHGKKSEWTRDALLDYLVDPVGYASKHPRLKEQGAKYSIPMPTFKMLKPEHLSALADHVLAMP